mmetsp:Transcript_41603/g.97651  ORF Transcript_41603/g.97651 Transcript_41603/m.97651 type:complete len:247 (-) Transcript_41603:2549-3289(-)
MSASRPARCPATCGPCPSRSATGSGSNAEGPSDGRHCRSCAEEVASCTPLLRLAGAGRARRLVHARRTLPAQRPLSAHQGQPHRARQAAGLHRPQLRLRRARRLVLPERPAAGLCRARVHALGLAPAARRRRAQPHRAGGRGRVGLAGRGRPSLPADRSGPGPGAHRRHGPRRRGRRGRTLDAAGLHRRQAAGAVRLPAAAGAGPINKKPAGAGFRVRRAADQFGADAAAAAILGSSNFPPPLLAM